jgi:hypothetical protein
VVFLLLGDSVGRLFVWLGSGTRPCVPHTQFLQLREFLVGDLGAFWGCGAL